MVKASEIRDRKSLETWLEGRPHAEAVTIAQRAACRVAPIAWARSAHIVRDRDYETLAVCRALLTTGVAVRSASSTIQDAVYHAFGMAYSSADKDASDAAQDDASAHARYAAAQAVYGADAAGYGVDAVIRAAFAAQTTAEAEDYIWEQVREDARLIEAGEDPLTVRLWSIPEPDWFRQAESAMRAVWQGQGPKRWTFWTRWWDGVLSGRQVDWELQREVALIDDDVWHQGPDAVAEAIVEIDRTLRTHRQTALTKAIRENPFALRIDVDAGSASFIADELREFDLSEIIDAVATSMHDFTRRTAGMMTGNQPGHALRETVNPAARELRRDLKRYAASPLKLHDAIGDAIREVVASAQREGVRSEPVLERLIGVWVRQQTDLCGTCPELLEMVQRRTMVQVALFTNAELRQALTLGQGLHDRSSGYLRVAAAWALRTIQDPSRPKEELQSAWYFLAAVLPRGADAAIRFEESRKAAKEGGVAKRIKDAADIAVAGDKIVDVAQENASEIWDFGHWVASEIMSGNWFGSGGGLG